MEVSEIKKAIIPVAGLGTRFLPMSLVLSKEFFPLCDKPIIHYIVQEIKDSGVSEIIFVVSPKQKMIMSYFQGHPELEKLLEKRKKGDILESLRNFEKTFEGINFSFVVQKNPLGDGHALLQAEKLLANEPVAVSFSDDVVDSETPAILQLIDVFKTCNAPVVALKPMAREKISAYGSVQVEKIASGFYKIKKIVEKPDPTHIQSDLVTVGKFVLTPEVFDYLKKATPSARGEIILVESLNKMLADGMPVYGYELKGDWLECGDKLKWLKSFLHMSLKDPVFGKELKEFIKTLR